VILSAAEETDLLRRINLYIKDETVSEFKLVKTGYSRGLWRKVKTNTHSNGEFQYMNILMGKPQLFPSQSNDFALCLTIDLKRLAAVNHTQAEIQRITYFPNGKYSDWRFMWSGYLAEVRDLYNMIISLYILNNSRILGDPFHLITAYSLPLWSRRLISRRMTEKCHKSNKIFSNNFILC
jgi:hypothetical protein